MKTILDTIIEHKRMEVLKRKGRKPLHVLVEKPNYKRTPLKPAHFFKEAEPGIIAEFKRKSPSKGVISDASDPVPIVTAYKNGGAVAASVLTDRDFFGGSFKDLENVRNSVGEFPLLRKDFIIDPYQIHEAKAYGADIILLIASVLTKDQIKELVKLSSSHGLSVLLEVHAEEELDKWIPGITMIGVNNRDLRNFSVDIQRSINLFKKLPDEALKISESGLGLPADIRMLFDIGYQGFLIGERFMKEADPGQELSNFINDIKVN
ncbi:indole-3-glycerol phosphate synthase TrpC [Bacteroidota bacterium]